MNEDDSEEMDQTERFAHIATQLAKGAYTDGEEDWKLYLVLGQAISEIEKLEDRDVAFDILDRLVNTLTFAHLHVIRYDDGEEAGDLPPITEDEIQDLNRRLFGKKDED